MSWWRASWRGLLPEPPAVPRVAATDETLAALRVFAHDPKGAPRVRAKALLALGAAGDGEIAADLLRIASSPRGAEHRTVVEHAVLALGLLPTRTDEARTFLLRTLSAPRATNDFVRPYAAIALGMHRESAAADAEAVAAFLAIAESTSESDPNVKAACLLAVGQLGDDAAVPRLLALLAKFDSVQAPYVVEALGRIGRPGTESDAVAVVDALASAISTKRVGFGAARSATSALARIAPNAMPKVQLRIVAALEAGLRSEDESTRGWSAIALGRIAGDASTDGPVRTRAVNAIAAATESVSSPQTRQFAVIAVGLAAGSHGVPAATADVLRALLRSALAAGTDAELRPAVELAVGLAGDSSARAALREIANGWGVPEVQGHFARLAGAMLDDPDTRDLVDGLRRTESELRWAAVAATGDRVFAGYLGGELWSADPAARDVGEMTAAFAHCGDAAAVESLVWVATHRENMYSASRAAAVAAVGRACGDFRPLNGMVLGLNFRAYVPAIEALADIDQR
jgi:HEAT repeat protein